MPKSSRSNSRQVSSQIIFGTEIIPVSIDFGRRRHLYITVNPDRSVQVSAPSREPMSSVMQFVKERADWIHLQREKIRHTQIPLQISCEAGANVLYLGEVYTLSLERHLLKFVELEGDRLMVCLPDPADLDQVRTLVEQWYIDMAKRVITHRLEDCFQRADLKGVDYPRLRVAPKKGSWGTCSAKGRLYINSELVKVPVDCIDYVLLHELCHLRYLNHSAAFYTLLSSVMPDWRRHKQELDKYIL